MTVVDRSESTQLPVGIIEFDRPYDLRFGGLNDEALAGYSLWGRGLDF